MTDEEGQQLKSAANNLLESSTATVLISLVKTIILSLLAMLDAPALTHRL